MAWNEPRWHPAAVQDAEEARNWYAERSPFAARGFLLALDDAVRAILLAPERDRWKSMAAVVTYCLTTTHTHSFTD